MEGWGDLMIGFLLGCLEIDVIFSKTAFSTLLNIIIVFPMPKIGIAILEIFMKKFFIFRLGDQEVKNWIFKMFSKSIDFVMLYKVAI